VRSRLGILSGICILVLAFSVVPALAGIRIDRIRFNPPGEDDGSNSSLNQEIIRVENTGADPVRLRGWMIHTAEHLVFYFPRFRLDAGRAVSIHTGEGVDSRKHLYWNLTIYAWDNDAGAATLYDRRMREIDACSYTGGGVSVIC
jgi:lamin tail-like protein